jgi:trehalose/maltose transport system substrate-binding protein
MTEERSAAISDLVNDFSRGNISRRDVLRRGFVLGLSAPVIASILHMGSLSAFAQDGTPIPDPGAGSTIVVPEGLRTDLAGQRVAAALSSSSHPDRPFLEAAMAKFSEVTGAETEFVAGETSTTDRQAMYSQQFAAQSPDIDVYQIDVVFPGIVAEHAVDLTPALGEHAKQHFEAIVSNNTVNGALIGVPWYTDAGLLFWRTDLAEKYGVSQPATWAELEASAKTVMDGERAAGNPDFFGFTFQGNAYEGLTCNGLEWQVSNGGGNIVEPDGTVSVNNEQAIAAFDRARSWIGTISPEGNTTYQEDESNNLFTAGNVMFLRNWPYAWAAGQESPAITGKIGVGVLPKGDGEGARNAATLGGWQLMVSKYSQNQDAAIEFVKFMTSPELELSFAVERAHLPTIASVYDAPELAEASEFMPRLKDVFQGGAVARPSSVSAEEYNAISTIYFTELNQVLTGAKSGADAAAAMEEQMTPIMEDLGY